jgi:hypothetical protein
VSVAMMCEVLIVNAPVLRGLCTDHHDVHDMDVLTCTDQRGTDAMQFVLLTSLP